MIALVETTKAKEYEPDDLMEIIETMIREIDKLLAQPIPEPSPKNVVALGPRRKKASHF